MNNLTLIEPAIIQLQKTCPTSIPFSLTKLELLKSLLLLSLISVSFEVFQNTILKLVDRKADGFQDEICLEWKRDKQKLETSF